MSIGEIIFFSTEGVLLIVMVVLRRIDTILNRHYKKLLDEAYSKDDQVLLYCLAHIMKDSIQKEDYETANRCKELIEKLQQTTNP